MKRRIVKPKNPILEKLTYGFVVKRIPSIAWVMRKVQKTDSLEYYDKTLGLLLKIGNPILTITYVRLIGTSVKNLHSQVPGLGNWKEFAKTHNHLILDGQLKDLLRLVDNVRKKYIDTN